MNLLDNIFNPVIILYCDYELLLSLVAVNKQCHQRLLGADSASCGYWPAMCNSFCARYGLYSPVVISPDVVLRMNHRQHLAKVLLPLRGKWNEQREQEAHKICVACRFRPGEPATGKVCLPLHQFIKVKRQQQQQQGDKENNAVESNQKLLVGENDPEEFVDPFLGALMRDPVLLTTSGRIVDRAVAVQCVLRGGKDPFNNQKLVMSMVIPQPDLAKIIQEWRDRPGQRDVSVDMKDLKGLVDCSSFNADCFEALLDLQRLHAVAKKAMIDSHHHAGHPEWDEEDQQQAAAEDEEAAAEAPEVAEIVAPVVAQDVGDHNEGALDITDPALAIAQEEEAYRRPSKNGEVARIVEVSAANSFVSAHVPGAGVQPFHFHAVHESKEGQNSVYDSSVQEAVAAALNGCNACVLCYGQTGSGKTYSYMGPEGHLEDSLWAPLLPVEGGDENGAQALVHQAATIGVLPASSGLVLRAAQEIFIAKEALMKGQGISMTCAVQIVEIYEDNLTDLLTGREVKVRRDNGLLHGASETLCSSLADLLPMLKVAQSRQRFAETAMNQSSSRAHTVLVWQLVQKKPIGFSASGEVEHLVVESHLHLVDLAGSERIKKSKVTGQQLKEAVGINSSLLTLGKVISALEQQSSHVPYLECKLTTVLRAAFGGNSRTTVLVNARPDEEHGDETLQSLRFGWRCGNISNQLKSRAMSLQSTVETIDQAMQNIQTQLAVLTRRNKQHLDSYKTLAQNFDMMQKKRKELLASHGNPVFEPTAKAKKVEQHHRPEFYM